MNASTSAAEQAPSVIDDERLRAWLREDAPFGDLTSDSLPLQGCAAQMRFAARGPMRVAGTEEAVRLVELAGARATLLAPSGASVAAGAPLVHGEGAATALLLAWKVAQTLVEAASGIATSTAAIVAALRDAGFSLPVACTRKTFPGTRVLAAKAVKAGGGVMHRLGLSESLLVFPEHRGFIPAADLAGALAALRRAQPEKRLVVEVGNDDDALAMARAGAEVLQLERFTPQALQALRTRLLSEGLAPKLAPAGGVNIGNALAFARAGADFLVTSAPYFAPPAEVQVRIGSPDANWAFIAQPGATPSVAGRRTSGSRGRGLAP
jgi:molybdenum transport protein